MSLDHKWQTGAKGAGGAEVIAESRLLGRVLGVGSETDALVVIPLVAAIAGQHSPVAVEGLPAVAVRRACLLQLFKQLIHLQPDAVG